MRVSTDLQTRLKLLMDLAVDDHDGPPSAFPHGSAIWGRGEPSSLST